MKNNIIFSKINAVDWPQIMTIEQKIYPNPWPLKTMQDCLNAGYQCIKGTSESTGDEIICYAFLMIGFEESNLLNISVNPNYQRQAIASRLLHHLFLLSKINQAKHMWLEVRESNHAAINLYKKQHFYPIGKRKNYYIYKDSQGKVIKEHAIIMSRKIIGKQKSP